MSGLQSYQKRILRLIDLITNNIQTDYEGDYSIPDLQIIKLLYLKVYEQQNPYQRQILYAQQKSKITNSQQLHILSWLEKERGRKYSGETLPQSVHNHESQSFQFCINPDYLDSGRFIGLTQNLPVSEKSSLEPIISGSLQLMLLIQPFTKKKFLFKKVKQRPTFPTYWIVEKTKDHRYVWRARDSIDRFDVYYLLKFILTKRSQIDICPSILINAGSHGDNQGKTAWDVGSFQYTDKMIYEQTMDTLARMINQEGPQLKLNKYNIIQKICIYSLSSSTGCIYPLKADHIIDTQCYGAFMSIKSQRLYPVGSFINQQLKFLSQSCPKDSSLSTLSLPMKKLLEESKIIKKVIDAYNLTQFFKFQYQEGIFETEIKHKRLSDLKFLFRASEHDFSIQEYFNLCGDQKNIFFLCLTERDKIIGAYSPLRHRYLWSIFENRDGEGIWRQDSDKDSFVFSVTNNQLFGLRVPERAIYRRIDQKMIIFGERDFSICDRANKVRQSVTNINHVYFNGNYEQTDNDKYSRSNCLRFNGNQTPWFLLKEWEVWKIQLCQVSFNPN